MPFKAIKSLKIFLGLGRKDFARLQNRKALA
jgi:hypothetical protein